jgi:hypothetical protein
MTCRMMSSYLLRKRRQIPCDVAQLLERVEAAYWQPPAATHYPYENVCREIHAFRVELNLQLQFRTLKTSEIFWIQETCEGPVLAHWIARPILPDTYIMEFIKEWMIMNTLTYQAICVGGGTTLPSNTTSLRIGTYMCSIVLFNSSAFL